MTVILGRKLKNELVIAGDKRGSDIQGNKMRDDLKKIVVLNNYLAIASAGNDSISKVIQMDLAKVGKLEDLTVDDVIDTIYKFYKKANELSPNIALLNAYFIIAGKMKSGNYKLYVVFCQKGNVEVRETECCILSPEDMKLQECQQILNDNILSFNKNYVENTIKIISERSKLVSSSGEKWTLDIINNKSQIESF